MAELSPGATLARYRIIAKIGAGGMGEVYRAQDTELGRSVALKFLSSDVSQHPNRLKRFIQEAKAASALNHPNILTVHEIGRVDEDTYIATEFVEGVTLRQRMRQQRLRLIEVLDIAIQVASALVAAHAAGIVHRDIKPENIMVRKDGIVKLLDFGLAKLSERQESLSGLEATTMALVNTEPGSVLGTATYMSPEQAAGREVDARSDIWSLGVVLYEMVAAHPPFEGVSKSHIIVAIMDREPIPITQFAPEVPEALEWIIAEALAKDPDERCQTAKEMLGKLKRLKQRAEAGALPTSPSELNRSIPSQSSIGLATTIPPEGASTLNETLRSTAGNLSDTQALSSGVSPTGLRQKIHLVTLVLGLIIVAAGGFGLYKLTTGPKEFGPARMTALTTGGKINGEDINGQLSISPDGKYVVCAANDARQQASLWLRQISTNSLVRIVPPETGGYLATTFSPDGELVYYVATLERNKFVPTLYRVPVLGGTPAKVLDRVFSAIGFSRDGKQFAFVRRNQDDTALMVANIDGSGEPRSIAVLKQPNGFSTSGPSWSPDGKIIASSVAMFGGRSKVVGFSVADGAERELSTESWPFAGRVYWLPDMSGLLVVAGESPIGAMLWIISYPEGRLRRITNDLNSYRSIALTEDGQKLVSVQSQGLVNLWVVPEGDASKANRLPTGNVSNFFSSTGSNIAWTPDGRIVFVSNESGNAAIWITNQDGTNRKQLTANCEQ